MNMKTTSNQEVQLKKRPKSEGNCERRPNWRTLTGVLLGLMSLSAAVGSSRADTLSQTNSDPITTPDVGQAGLYPSQIGFGLNDGTITAVRVTLHNVTHTFPGDYDILLVGPGGQKALLMSDCGEDNPLNNVTLTFSELSPPLPITAQITSGTYRPSNYGGATETFPPNGPLSYPASLAVFNNTSPNGLWSLYVVDDTGSDTGTIAGGWTLEIDTTAFESTQPFTIPGTGTDGNANPYPSIVNVTGLPTSIRRASVRLTNLSHTFPDDIDMLLVGPDGQNAIILSDVGGSIDFSGLTLTLDDSAANSLPDSGAVVDGTFKPTNFGAGDAFPAPAPAPLGTSALSVFNGTNPNGAWTLYVVDDLGGDTGSMSRWDVNFVLEPTLLANISTRLKVETGDNVLIGGFIVTGTQPKKVILRAIGPSLNLPGQLTDTTMELRDGGGALIWFNDDWHDGSQGFPSQETEILASTIPPSNELESAIVATLPANNANYTVIVRGFQNRTGIALVEAYDLDQTVDSKLANISTRGLVQTGDNVLIAGTIVLGFTPQRVLVRAIGPSLSVAGKLLDPTLELRDGQGTLIAANDDWQSDQAEDIIATTVPPTDSHESAVVATLPAAGAFYTAIVRGFDNTTGVGLVEIYGLD
jgi:subtilisin-like proprotein convertase family protein